MSYKTILVHVDTDARSPARVELAAQFAQRDDAHLIGLHAFAPLRAPAYVRAEMGDEWLALEQQAAQRIARDLEAAFQDVARRNGIAGAEWRVSRLDAAEAFSLHARFADLVVLGQHDADEQRGSVDADFPEIVALQSGRPVLVVPYAGRFEEVGRQVLIAWNGSREATRAVTDALPFLRRAKGVTVLSVNAPRGRAGDGWVPGTDCALFLARHGVKVEASSDPAVDIDVGNYLLSRASDLGADLIVMGAYGHNRLRELVLGGVTRTIVQHMTVPVLLSH